MKKIVLAAVIAILASTSFAQTQTPYIEVVGVADTSVAPNKIEILIELNQAESKGKISMLDLEKALATSLEQADIDIEKQVVITNQSSNSAKKDEVYQYKNYKVTVSDVSQATILFQCLYNNNVASANLGSTSRTDINEIRNRVQIEAIKNAKSVAKTLVEAIGQKIGPAIEIQETNYQVYGGAYANMAADFKSSNQTEESPLLNVKIQDINVSQRVTVRFELL